MLSEHWDLRIWLCVFLLRSTKSLFISRKTLKLIWIRLYNGPYQPTRISGNITSVELKLQCVRLFWTSFSFNFGFLSFFFVALSFFFWLKKKIIQELFDDYIRDWALAERWLWHTHGISCCIEAGDLAQEPTPFTQWVIGIHPEVGRV